MSWKRVALALAAVACGPTVAQSEAETTGNGADEGSSCLDTACEPQTGSSTETGQPTPSTVDGGCVGDGCGPAPCEGPEDCQGIATCGADGACVPVAEIDRCRTKLAFAAVPVPLSGDDRVEQIRFVDADGDLQDDLAIVRPDSLELFFGPGLDAPSSV
jgi:hypothetical protein